MATLGAELPAEQAAQIFNLLDELATMAKADGDSRPIRQIRTEVFWQLLSRPGGSGLPIVQTKLIVHATLESLEGAATAPGDVEGFLITHAQLRELLHRVGALGLHTPED